MAASRTKPAPGLLTRDGVPTSLVNLLLKSLASPNTRASYAKGIADLYTYADGKPITLPLLMDWRISMAKTKSTSTVNLRMTAARALIKFAHRRGLLDAPTAFELLSLGGLPSRGVRAGKWLTSRQVTQLLAVPNKATPRGARNYCILAIFSGCALRLHELAKLDVALMQIREERWVFTDILGKGNRVRTVAIPVWVRRAITNWMRQSNIKDGLLIRQLTLKPEGLTRETIREIVSRAAEKINVKNFGPHDLRRTCARHCYEAGAGLEELRIFLGHASIETTQRYLGIELDLRNAVNDRLHY